MANRTVTIKASGGTYTSLATALATEDDTYADLVTNTMILTFECYASVDDTAAVDTGTGWTTSSSYYLNITCPVGERHTGTWDDTKYNLVVNADSPALFIQENFTKVSYLQVAQINGHASAQYIIGGITAVTGIVILGCLCTKSTNDSLYGICLPAAITADGTNIAVNCIVSGSNISTSFYLRSGTTEARRTYVLNCTSYGAVTQFRSRNSYCNIINCLAIGGTNNFDEITAFEVSDYCGWDEAYTAGGTNGLDLSAVADADIFTNAGSQIFSLVNERAGRNLYDYAPYSFQTDIAGTDRGGAAAAWSVGAFELAAGGPYASSQSGVGFSLTGAYSRMAGYKRPVSGEW